MATPEAIDNLIDKIMKSKKRADELSDYKEKEKEGDIVMEAGLKLAGEGLKDLARIADALDALVEAHGP